MKEKPVSLGRVKKIFNTENIEIFINKKEAKTPFEKECVLLHEMVHVIDLIVNDFPSISDNDWKIKSVLLGTIWETLRKKQIISGKLLRQNGQSNALDFIWAQGKDSVPTKLLFEKEEGELREEVREYNIVIPPQFDESDIIEKIYRKELKAFGKRQIFDKETRAYVLGTLWGELIEKEY